MDQVPLQPPRQSLYPFLFWLLEAASSPWLLAFSHHATLLLPSLTFSSSQAPV